MLLGKLSREQAGSRRTVQTDLKRLVELGLVVEEDRAPTDPNRAYRWVGPEL